MRSSIRLTKNSRRFGVAAAVLGGVALAGWPVSALANVVPPTLLTAANYAAIAGTGITNSPGTGTVINGAAAVYPASATAVTGFPPGTYTSLDAASGSGSAANALQAQTDLTAAYTEAANATPFTNLTGTDLGSLTLGPGVYRFTSNAQLTGTLTLDGDGQTNPTFIFQMEAELTTATAASVAFINGANACALYWQVTSEATLGSSTTFQGNLMAQAGITMGSDASIGVGGGVDGGRALVSTVGLLSMDTANVIDEPTGGCVYAASTTTPLTGPPSTLTPDTGAFGFTPGGVPLDVVGLLLLSTGVLATSTGLPVRRNRA